MLHWSHYRFRQRLLFKAGEYPGVTVKLVTEEYTSKTCGSCSAVHHHLGSSKQFVCPSCGWSCDRDVNGARNIMLKALSEDNSFVTSYAISSLRNEQALRSHSMPSRLLSISPSTDASALPSGVFGA